MKKVTLPTLDQTVNIYQTAKKEQAAGIIHNLLSNERVTVAVTDESVFTTDKKPIYNTSKVTAHHAIIPTVKELTKEVLETFQLMSKLYT